MQTKVKKVLRINRKNVNIKLKTRKHKYNKTQKYMHGGELTPTIASSNSTKKLSWWHRFKNKLSRKKKIDNLNKPLKRSFFSRFFGKNKLKAQMQAQALAQAKAQELKRQKAENNSYKMMKAKEAAAANMDRLSKIAYNADRELEIKKENLRIQRQQEQQELLKKAENEKLERERLRQKVKKLAKEDENHRREKNERSNAKKTLEAVEKAAEEAKRLASETPGQKKAREVYEAAKKNHENAEYTAKDVLRNVKKADSANSTAIFLSTEKNTTSIEADREFEKATSEYNRLNQIFIKAAKDAAEQAAKDAAEQAAEKADKDANKKNRKIAGKITRIAEIHNNLNTRSKEQIIYDNAKKRNNADNQKNKKFEANEAIKKNVEDTKKAVEAAKKHLEDAQRHAKVAKKDSDIARQDAKDKQEFLEAAEKAYNTAKEAVEIAKNNVEDAKVSKEEEDRKANQLKKNTTAAITAQQIVKSSMVRH